MDRIISSPWFWSILVYVYFLVKDLFISRLFKTSQAKVHPIVNQLLAIAAMLVNLILIQEYDRYLQLTSIKGSITLPHFSSLFLLIDGITSVGIVAILAFKRGLTLFSTPYARLSIDIIRLVLVFIIFLQVISAIWMKQTNVEMGWDYQCFKYQVAIDLANYYYQNHEFPAKLEEFTLFTSNPFNTAPLLYTAGEQAAIYVRDAKENVIVEGPKDLLGLQLYENNPKQFFIVYDIANRNVCNGELRLPHFDNK
jgi:hypothetical protein